MHQLHLSQFKFETIAVGFFLQLANKITEIIINEMPMNIDPFTIRNIRNPKSQVELKDEPPKQDMPNEQISKQKVELTGADGGFMSVFPSVFFFAWASCNAVTALSKDAIAASNAASDAISPMTVFIISAVGLACSLANEWQATG